MARSPRLRAPTEEGRPGLERFAHARTAPARLVERARVVWAALRREWAEASADRFQVAAIIATPLTSLSEPVGAAVER